MRIIAGSAKGRRLRALRGEAVRPTADRVKEALFSIVASRFDFDGATVLDLFAGSGALGLEALSRGAARAVFVEHHRAAADALRRNAEACGFAGRVEVLVMPAGRALRELARRPTRFDGVLLDPPYGKGLLAETLTQLAAAAVLGPGAWVVAEGHVDDQLAGAYGPLRLTQTRRYGKTALTLFGVTGESEEMAES